MSRLLPAGLLAAGLLAPATEVASGQNIITTFAGTGETGYNGDNRHATTARLYRPFGIAIDAAGNVYIGEREGHRVRVVGLDRVIATVAGTGEPGQRGYFGEGKPARAVRLSYPGGIAIDRAGNLYFTDTSDRVRRVDPSGVITTFAGGGESSDGDGGQATSADLSESEGVAVDAAGNIYIAESASHRIRKVDPAGIITTVAGTGQAGFSGDGGPAVSAQLYEPIGVALDDGGVLYISEYSNHRIRKVDPAGVITTVAGTGEAGFSGDGGPAISAQLNYPGLIAADGAGNLYIADLYNHRVRKVDTDGIITTVVGTGQAEFSADGGEASSASLNYPLGVALDGAGNLYVADLLNHRVRKIENDSGPPPPEITAAATITTIAGTGTPGYNRDGIAATSARLSRPSGVAADGAGNVYIGDQGNHRVREVSTSGVIASVAGTGAAGFSGDEGRALWSQLREPAGVEIGPDGRLYFADTGNGRVRAVSLVGPSAGTMTTLGDPSAHTRPLDVAVALDRTLFFTASNAMRRLDPDGGPLDFVAPEFAQTTGMAVGPDGTLYAARPGTHRVLKKAPGGPVETLAGTGESGFSGDGGPATAARLDSPQGVALGRGGTLYIADEGNHRVRKVAPDGTISTVAGTGEPGFSGDGGPAGEARLDSPWDVALEHDGNLLIADRENHRIRRVAVNVSPRAAFTARLVDVTVTFDAAASADPDGSIVSYEWDFGDWVTRSGTTATHTYGPGAYTATLTVTDDAGATATARAFFSPGITRAIFPERTPVCGGRPATIVGSDGHDVIHGTPGPDVIVAGDGDDEVEGGAGDDIICLGAGSDRAAGGDGDDTLYGGDGVDVLVGDDGADTLHGHLGDDLLIGGDGADRLVGGGGGDRLLGGAANDRLYGGHGDDLLLGGPGDDFHSGGLGQNRAIGGPGTDRCFAEVRIQCEP